MFDFVVQGVFDTHYVYHIGTFDECAQYQHDHDLLGCTVVVPL